jgi:hypothetical protein
MRYDVVVTSADLEQEVKLAVVIDETGNTVEVSFDKTNLLPRQRNARLSRKFRRQVLLTLNEALEHGARIGSFEMESR